jgi:hypothetical protein
MISRNHTQIFPENPLKNFSSSKTFVVHKLKKNNMKIQNLKQKMNLLFNTPESYLKLPEESLFNYIIGQTPRGLGLYTESSRMISSSVIGNYTKKTNIENHIVLIAIYLLIIYHLGYFTKIPDCQVLILILQ